MKTTNRSLQTRKVTSVIAFISCFFLPGVSVAAAEPSAAKTSLVAAASSRLWLAGDSTLHPFTINATKFEAAAGLDGSFAAGSAEARAAVLGGALKSLSLSVPVADLKSGDAGLDKNMRKALQQDRAPVIRFTLADYKTAEAKDGSLIVKARGRLAIAGVEKDTVVEGACRFGPDGLEVTGANDVLMSDFGIKPPTMMLGTIKTADKVVVHFDLKLKASDAAPAVK